MGFRVWGIGFRVWGLALRDWGLGFGVWALGFGFRVFGVEGLVFGSFTTPLLMLKIPALAKVPSTMRTIALQHTYPRPYPKPYWLRREGSLA